MSDLLTFVLQLKETVSGGIQKVGVTTSSVFKAMDNKIAETHKKLNRLGEVTKIVIDHSHLDDLEEHLDRVNRKKEQLSTWEVAKGTMIGELAVKGGERAVDFGIDFLKESVMKGLEEEKTQMMMNVMSPKAGEELYEQTHANLLKSMYGTQLFGDAKSLLASHLNNSQIDKRLRQFEDIAGGEAGNLDQLVETYQLVKGTGKLNLHETFPLLRMGFDPISTLQQKHGGSVMDWHKRLEDGAQGLKLFNEALDIATGKGGIFDHMQERLMTTDYGKYTLAATNYEASKAKFGEHLLPIMGKLLDKLTPAIDKLPATLDRLVPGIEYLGNKTVDLITWTTTHTSTIKEWIKTTGELIKWAVGAYATMTLINTGKGFMGGLSGAGKVAGVLGAAGEGISGFSVAAWAGGATGMLEAATGMSLAAVGGTAALMAAAAYGGWKLAEIIDPNKSIPTSQLYPMSAREKHLRDITHIDENNAKIEALKINGQGQYSFGAASSVFSKPLSLLGNTGEKITQLTDKLKKTASDASDALSDMSDSIIGGGPKQIRITANFMQGAKITVENAKDGAKELVDNLRIEYFRMLKSVPGME